MTSQELVNAFCEKRGLGKIEFDRDGICSFDAPRQGLSFFLETNEEGSLLHAAVEIGDLTEMNRAYVPEALLIANGGHSPLQKGIFTLEGDEGDRVVYTQTFVAAAVSVDYFLEKMEEFVADAVDWQWRLRRPDLGLEDEADDDAELEAPAGPGENVIRG